MGKSMSTTASAPSKLAGLAGTVASIGMSSLGLYVAAVLIWGSTWIAITFQLGRVPPEVSVAYRFALASFMLLAWCAARGLRLAFPWRDHVWMALQGSLLFGINYVCVYLAEGRINSGLVALIFSLMVFLNILGARIFFATPLNPTAVLGAILGVSGVALIFLPELTHSSGMGHPGLGVALALVGMVSASFGNMVASRNQRHGLPVVQLNAFGMLYGALFVALYALAIGRPFVFDGSTHYLLSLAYLALFGSVFAFGAYLTLIGRIGADRAGYAMVAIPMVALLISTLFEGLPWRSDTLVGAGLCLAGNALVLQRRHRSARGN
jgi:drug/metabolite transporter (DMT)-like permease